MRWCGAPSSSRAGRKAARRERAFEPGACFEPRRLVMASTPTACPRLKGWWHMWCTRSSHELCTRAQARKAARQLARLFGTAFCSCRGSVCRSTPEACSSRRRRGLRARGWPGRARAARGRPFCRGRRACGGPLIARSQCAATRRAQDPGGAGVRGARWRAGGARGYVLSLHLRLGPAWCA